MESNFAGVHQVQELLCNELAHRYWERGNYFGDVHEGNCVHGGKEVVQDGETHVGLGSQDGNDGESGGDDGKEEEEEEEEEELFVEVADACSLGASDGMTEPILEQFHK